MPRRVIPTVYAPIIQLRASVTRLAAQQGSRRWRRGVFSPLFARLRGKFKEDSRSSVEGRVVIRDGLSLRRITEVSSFGKGVTSFKVTRFGILEIYSISDAGYRDRSLGRFIDARFNSGHRFMVEVTSRNL